MNKINLTFLVATVIIIILATACSSISYTGVWKDNQELRSKSYKTIFIATLTNDLDAKQIIENDLALAIEAKGFKTFKSSDYFKPNFNKENASNEQSVINLIKSLGCDGILTASLIDEKSETRYVPGTRSYYSPYTSYRYYGQYWPYYNSRYSMVYSPGYYTNDKSYFFENNFYDLESGNILFSMQSKAVNPPGLSAFSKDYASSLIKQLEKEGIIK